MRDIETPILLLVELFFSDTQPLFSFIHIS